MGHVRIRDDAIWVSHIEGDPALRRLIEELEPGEVVKLEVDGVGGEWERMRTGKDGRPTLGVKPVGPMRDAWKKLQRKRGKLVTICREKKDSYLQLAEATLDEWSSPEDEAAYAHLPKP